MSRFAPLLATLLTLPALAQDPSGAALLERAHKLHQGMFTVDTHVDTPGWLASGFDLGRRHQEGEKGAGCLDFPRMKEGGLASAFFAVFVGQGPCTPEGRAGARAKALAQLDLLDRMFKDHADLCERALGPDDARRIFPGGKRAIFLGLENGYPLGLDLELVDTFHARGIRYITLAHTADNDLCDSSTGKRQGPERGLTPFGAQVVRRMNELGILVDVSHISDKAFFDVLKVSKAPVLASHSCARALSDHPRNLSDEMLRALKAKGGVIQLCILDEYVKKLPPNPAREAALKVLEEKVQRLYGGWGNIKDRVAMEALDAEWEGIHARFPGPPVTVKDAVDHIDHIVKTIGIDHVGIGTDFDGGGRLQDCRDVTQLPAITAELLRRGYREPDIRKIWGGNFLRVFDQATAVARGLTAK